jgi:hypothetical protein
MHDLLRDAGHLKIYARNKGLLCVLLQLENAESSGSVSTFYLDQLLSWVEHLGACLIETTRLCLANRRAVRHPARCISRG